MIKAMPDIGAISSQAAARSDALRLHAFDLKGPQPASPNVDPKSVTGPVDFAGILSQAVSPLLEKQAESAAVTRSVLLGQGAPLHQGMIAMQEASVAFSLMVEVRNKVVEGFQELMRMPV
ncbi:MAG: flagellar hook-basal body complex protein FliE [Opitutaceae bacterium]